MRSNHLPASGSNSRLEVDLCSKLVAARVRYDAVRLAEVWIAVVDVEPRSEEIGIATKVRMVQRVEEIERQADAEGSSSEARQILSESHVNVLIREGTRYRESATREA